MAVFPPTNHMHCVAWDWRITSVNSPNHVVRWRSLHIRSDVSPFYTPKLLMKVSVQSLGHCLLPALLHQVTNHSISVLSSSLMHFPPCDILSPNIDEHEDTDIRHILSAQVFVSRYIRLLKSIFFRDWRSQSSFAFSTHEWQALINLCIWV